MTRVSAPIEAAAGRVRSRWLTGLWRQGGAAMPLAVALPLGGGLLLLVQASLLAGILHAGINEDASLRRLLPAFAGLGAVMTLRIALAHGAERAGSLAAERIKMHVRRDLFDHILSRHPDWTADRSSGALASLFVEQIETFDGFFAKYLPAMVQSAVLPLAFALAVLPVDWVAGTLFLVTAPLIPVFMALVGWGAQEAGERQALAMSRLSGAFADRLRGLTTLRLFGRGEAEANTMRKASEDLARGTMRVLRIAFLSSAVLEFFAALGVAGVALYVGLTFLGLVHLAPGVLGLEAGLFCLLMAPEVYQPLRLLAAHYHDRAAARSAVAEIARQLGTLPPVRAAPAPAAIAAPAQRRLRDPLGLEARGLTLSTPDGRTSVLEDVCLSVAAGTTTALRGPSGIGKSTLLETIAGLRAGGEGSLFLGARALADIPERERRELVAWLGQRPRIFHGTIAENIRLARPGASNADLRRAADRACVSDFADDLDRGLDTLVGESGLGLSGGEAHRVALARLYLRDPALVLLDEPTAHLDRICEDRVLDGILGFCAGRTLIVATHSPAVCGRLDRTIDIAERRLVPDTPVMRPSLEGQAA